MIFKLLPFIPLLLLLGCDTKEKPLHVKQEQTSVPQENVLLLKEELSQIDSDAYLEAYIIRIINNGSNGTLGFSGGAMDAGIAAKEDAPNIARYVMSLSGKKSSNDEEGQKAQMFYTSNCGGCHGNDGKGLNGAFPDLSLKTFKGISKRKAYLASRINIQ